MRGAEDERGSSMTGQGPGNAFTADIAGVYESALVPLIFDTYAQDLAFRVSNLGPSSVLEVACGTGVVTRALAGVLPEGCAITATDVSSAMIAEGMRVGTARPVSWQQADVGTLPFADGAFDVVVCQFGVMFFPDIPGAYREIGRVLGPGGTFLFNLWNDIGDNEFADVVTEAMNGHFPHDPPTFLAKTPLGHGGGAEIEVDLRRAGFGECLITPRDDVSVAPNPRLPAVAYCQGTPLRSEILARDPEGLEEATRVAAEALRTHFGDGPLEGRISGVVVSACLPSGE
jgi:SAM-dependent methyltransferase